MSNVSDEIDFQIYGDDMQTVEVELDPGETVVAEAGAMNWMEEGIRFEARMGDGSAVASGFFGSLLGAGKRILTGESLFMTHFTNDGIGKGRVALLRYPGKIMPIHMAELGVKSSARRMRFCARHVAQRCPSRSTSVWGRVSRRRRVHPSATQGGWNGLLACRRTIVQKQLNNESLRIDTGCIVAYAGQIDYSVEAAGGLKSMFFGGEGLFLATLRGTGTVWLQSLPFSRLANRILSNAPAAGGNSKGERSTLGQLGRMIDGDFRI